jgi:hypothetical protein
MGHALREWATFVAWRVFLTRMLRSSSIPMTVSTISSMSRPAGRY